MNILAQVNLLLSRLSIPVETGSMKQATSDKYIVLVPLADSYPVSADNLPIADVQELRITIFSKENYIKLKNQIISILLSNDFCITESWSWKTWPSARPMMLIQATISTQ